MTLDPRAVQALRQLREAARLRADPVAFGRGRAIDTFTAARLVEARLAFLFDQRTLWPTALGLRELDHHERTGVTT